MTNVDPIVPDPYEIFKDFKGFSKTENKSARLRDELRTAASALRGTEANPFFSMPDIAKFFGVSYGLVSRAYAELEREDLLTRKRGVGTFVTPVRGKPQVPVRGVVGVPVWLPGFFSFRDWTGFVTTLEESLRLSGFVADLIFYYQGEEREPEFIQRVLAHHPDVLVWLHPAQEDREVLSVLKDRGVSLRVVTNEGVEMPGKVANLSWKKGIEKAMATWKKEGISSVICPRAPESLSANPPGRAFMERMRVCGMRCSTSRPDSQVEPFTDYIRQLHTDGSVGVVFDDPVWFEALCTLEPRTMMDLFQGTRVLITQEVTLPLVREEAAQVDFLGPDLRRLAGQIADGLDRGIAWKAPVQVEAEWRPRCSIWDVAQSRRYHVRALTG